MYKKNFLKMMELSLLFGSICVGFVACSSDDDDEKDNGGNSSIVDYSTTRLKTIKRTYYYSDKNDTESGILTYDDAGQIASFSNFKYEYDGKNGGAVFLDKDGTVKYFEGGPSIEYKNNRLVMIGNGKENYRYTWDGNNLKQMVENYKGEIETWVWKYNNIKTHPLIHFLFGFHAYGGDVMAAPSLVEIGFVLPLYKHLGKLPDNLFSEVVVTGEDNNTYTSTFSYSMDNDGNVKEITIIENGDKNVYTLTWEKLK